MPRLGRLLVALGGLAGLVAISAYAMLAFNAVVLVGSSGQVIEAPSGAPRAQVAIVLGARVEPDGTMSAMLADRVAVGARLYREGKVSKVLASGDHGRQSYDEVNAMRDGLLRAGVPARDVFTDHAGFDTWSSMVRARKVFGVRSALVVSQGFHLPRAAWLGERAGIEIHGVSADLHDYGRQSRRSTLREWLARPKATQEVLLRREPRFLGPPIPISGDGRASLG